MSQTIIRKTKWFWPWQEDQEEAWLEQMSLQGLHLKKAHILAQYDFHMGQPHSYVYRMDFRDKLKSKNKDEYLSLFNEMGWEYLGEMSGWQYFRRLAQPGDVTEIFTDPDTKIQKYNRYLAYMGLVFSSYVVYLVVFTSFWGTWPDWIMWLNIAIIILGSMFSIVTMLNIMERIKQLKGL